MAKATRPKCGWGPRRQAPRVPRREEGLHGRVWAGQSGHPTAWGSMTRGRRARGPLMPSPGQAGQRGGGFAGSITRSKGRTAVGPAGGLVVGDWSEGLRTPRAAGVGGARRALGSAVLRWGGGLRLEGVRVGDQQGWAQSNRAEPWGETARGLSSEPTASLQPALPLVSPAVLQS